MTIEISSTRSGAAMIRRAVAAFLAAHGFAHLVGFMGSWRLGELADAPYTTSILNGMVDVGDSGIRVLGLLWVVAGAAFAVAAVAVWRRGLGAARVLAAAALLSGAVCLAGLPAAGVGLVIDAAILAVLAGLFVVRPGAMRLEPR
jgi:hypothetical protein